MLRFELTMFCVQYTQSWGLYGMLSWLPTLISERYGVAVGDLAAFTVLPYGVYVYVYVYVCVCVYVCVLWGDVLSVCMCVCGMYAYMCACVCVCLCVIERRRMNV